MSKKSAPMFALLATLALGGNAQAAAPPPSVPTATTAAPTVTVPSTNGTKAAMAALRPDGTLVCPVKGKKNEFVTYKAAWSITPISTPIWIQESKPGKSPMPPDGVCGEDDVYVSRGSTRGNPSVAQMCLEATRSKKGSNVKAWNKYGGVYGTAAGVIPTSADVAGYCVPYAVALAQHNTQLGLPVAPVVDNDPDKDGLIGPADKCPNEAGPSSNDGCPDKDTDKDGFFDRIDRCPAEPGIAPDGCPVKTVAAEPAPPAAATVLVAAPEAPKAAKNDEKKVFGTAAVKIGTDTTKTTVGSLNVSLLAGLCATGNALQQNVKTADGKNLVKPWFICPTVSFGQATRWYPRGGEATHFAFGLDMSFLTGIRGLNTSGSAYRDNMRTNGVFAGPSLWMLLTYASLFDQSFLANIGGGAGLQLKAVMGIVTLGIGAGVGACRVAKPGYSPSLLSQPGAEVCGKFDAFAGVAF